MREISAQLDERPDLALEMVELDNRNRLAHKELQMYNDHRLFLYKHPFTQQRRQYDEQLSELCDLKQNDPSALTAEIANVVQNIRRIRSNLNKKKYKSDAEKQAWEQNLSRAELREKIIEEVIKK
jgi:hypothetical protein